MNFVKKIFVNNMLFSVIPVQLNLHRIHIGITVTFFYLLLSVTRYVDALCGTFPLILMYAMSIGTCFITAVIVQKLHTNQTTGIKSNDKQQLCSIKRAVMVFIRNSFVNRIVLVKCLFPEVFQHMLRKSI